MNTGAEHQASIASSAPSTLLVSFHDLDKASEQVAHIFLGPLESIVLGALIRAPATKCKDGYVYRSMTSDSSLQERMKMSASSIRSTLSHLHEEGMVMCVCLKAGSGDAVTVESEERQCLWGVNSERLADALVFKLEKVCAVASSKAPKKTDVQKYRCLKCSKKVSALDFDLSDCMNESGDGFVCDDVFCRGELVEEEAPLEMAHSAFSAAEREARELIRMMQRALPAAKRFA